MKNRISFLLILFVFCRGGWGAEESFIRSSDVYKRISKAIDKIKVVDGHEHIRSEADVLKDGPPDFFKIFISAYVRTDIKSTGNTFANDEKFLDESLSVKQRWKSFAPVYARLKNTGYIRSTKIGLEKVHGIEIKNAESINKINASIKRLYKPGVYKKVLCDLGNIDYVINMAKYPAGYEKDKFPPFFRGVRAFEQMVIFTSQDDIYQMEKQYGIRVHSVDDIEKIYRKYIDESIASGIIGFKYTGAYLRSLDFADYSREKADTLLKKLLQNTEAHFSWAGGTAFSIEKGEPLSNYCMHTMLKIIEEKGFPVSIHTGIQNRGSNDVRNSNPQLLIPLFKEYRNINFDIFHGGFPCVTEFIELGKNWPNVYLDFCWSHIITPEGAKNQLSEAIECVPANKIFAFGGDLHYPEQVIGHLEMAKENVAIVLAEKVLDGSFSEQQAIGYAEQILRTNAIEFYKLDRK